MDPLYALLSHRPMPALAAAVRNRVGEITRAWAEAVEGAQSPVTGTDFDELRENLPAILESMAEALAAADHDAVADLVRRSPVQGLAGFGQDYGVAAIMREDRLLRGVIVIEVEAELGRTLRVAEAASLHGAVDLMLQRAVIALVGEQRAALRAAAEQERRYLSFLSHDMNNNLNGVVLSLQLAAMKLGSDAGREEVAGELRGASAAILDTIGGMRQLLDQERVRRGTVDAGVGEVDLCALVGGVAGRLAAGAESKGLGLGVSVPKQAVAEVSRELLMLVLQNLIGNAVKYTREGRVGVTLGRAAAGEGRWVMIRVSDTGPGIAEEGRAALFEAFRRGESHDQPGLGLGLAIASQAAKLMGAELSVESELGKGSVFTVVLGEAVSWAEWPDEVVGVG